MSEAAHKKIFTPEHREKMRVARIGRKASEEHKRKISEANQGENHPMWGKHHSDEAKKKMSESRRGSKNGNWKGGITPLEQIIRHSDKYLEWRDNIFARDLWLCQHCFSWDDLEVHHPNELRFLLKKYGIINLEEACRCEALWTMKEGITLCGICHGCATSPKGTRRRRKA